MQYNNAVGLQISPFGCKQRMRLAVAGRGGKCATFVITTFPIQNDLSELSSRNVPALITDNTTDARTMQNALFEAREGLIFFTVIPRWHFEMLLQTTDFLIEQGKCLTGIKQLPWFQTRRIPSSHLANLYLFLLIFLKISGHRDVTFATGPCNRNQRL